MNKGPFYIVILILFLTSCQSKIYFTYDLKKKLEEKELDIQKVQFYNSERIILTRTMPHNEAQVSEGEIKFENGKYVEEIIINRETPGACRVDNGMVLDISFEAGDKVVHFKRNKMKNYYELDFERKGDLTARVLYDSLVYTVHPIGEEAKLMIRKNDKYIYQLDQRVAEGVIIK